ncbi:Vacuolar protein sorting-associated protein 35 [Phlyctochytrium planicorne]|nr:Vacuolar protein sorting-associated protein 35 [Phlyctochytrium planicorne]
MTSTPTGISTPPVEDQGKVLEEALGIVKVQAFHMKRCLDNGKLMDALKHCSTMLAELRTSSLTPKNYYELYMAIFNELQHLSTYLYEGHVSKRHHLSDLYELVQYAGNIVPRLYLMITVGAVYMKVSREATDKKRDADQEAEEEEEVHPIKELMRDMMEMSRGVQHPTRGLFLRYYLSGLTRDYLPDGTDDGPQGTIADSIDFILQNFIEMNKLWVRLQFQGHSREREKREKERKELRLLVGSNLVRLSQLEGLDLETFRGNVLPKVLDEIVSCKDIMAQEYLMEVIIQVFQDDFHLRTLDTFLSATAKLHRNVNVKQTVISLIDRFASYAARIRDEKPSDGSGAQGTGIPEDLPLFEVFWTQVIELIQARPEFTIQDVISLLASLINLSVNCYPDRLDNADQILGFAKEKILEALSQKSAELNSEKTTDSILQLLLAPIQAYRENPLILLRFPSSSTQVPTSKDSPSEEVHSPSSGWASQYANPAKPGQTPKLPFQQAQSLCGNYTDILLLQPYSTRRAVGLAAAKVLLKAGEVPLAGGKDKVPFRISTVDEVDAVLGELCSVLVRDQKDSTIFGSRKGMLVASAEGDEVSYESKRGENVTLDWEDISEEQNMVAKLVHLVQAKGSNPEDQFLLLAAARKHFGEGGDIRIRFTLPPFTMACLKLARDYFFSGSPNRKQRLIGLYKFIHQTVLSLSTADDQLSEDDLDNVPMYQHYTKSSAPRVTKGLQSPAEISLRLFLMAARSADETGHEELSYEFFVQALTLYEESVSDSRAQTQAITLIIGTLYTTTIFGYENYETLITKCTVHCSRLLKRADQCRGVAMASHLFWAGISGLDEGVTDEEGLRRVREKGRVVYRNGKKVLECLQKSLKIADTITDPAINVELFVEILEKYVWYFEKRNDAITIKYLNSLIDLIQTNLATVNASVVSSPAPTDTVGRRVPDSVAKHFRNLLQHLRLQQHEESTREVHHFSGGFGLGGGGGMWGELSF